MIALIKPFGFVACPDGCEIAQILENDLIAIDEFKAKNYFEFNNFSSKAETSAILEVAIENQREPSASLKFAKRCRQFIIEQQLNIIQRLQISLNLCVGLKHPLVEFDCFVARVISVVRFCKLVVPVPSNRYHRRSRSEAP